MKPRRAGPPKRKQRGYYLPPDVVELVERLAKEQSISASEVVCRALLAYSVWPEQIRKIIREELDR